MASAATTSALSTAGPSATIPTIHHLAPAGSSYTSTESAGNTINRRYCDGFPNTTKSFFLPKYLSTKYPELSTQTKDSNKSGERAEYIVHRKFISLTRKPLLDPILGLVSLNLDNDNKHSIKKNSLYAELTGVNLNSVNMRGEHDLIILVKNVGVVVVEVKRSASPENVQKAEDQLANSEELIQCLWRAVDGSATAKIPTAKVIAIPEEKSRSPTAKTSYGSYSFYKDVMNNLQPEFQKVMIDLHSQPSNPVNVANFQRLADILTGLWTMKPRNKRYAVYDETEASDAEQLVKIDRAIDTADFVSKTGKKTTKNYSTKPTEIFQQTTDIHLLHLTPPQKDVYDNYPRVILRGHGGTGKSILAMLKIVETLQQNPLDNMVIIAPNPHHLRCYHYLVNNNIASNVITEFPYIRATKTKTQKIKSFFSSDPATLPTNNPIVSNVFVMTLKDFFGVHKNTLLSYDLSNFHVVVDDLQGYEVGEGCSSYGDIAEFIEQTHKEMKGSKHLLWVCLDAAQQYHYNLSIQHKATELFTKRSFFRTVEREFATPVVELIDVLRNSAEITDTVKEVREQQLDRTGFDKSRMLPNFNSGHEITCEVVVHHHLISVAPSRHDEEQFVCERVLDELHLLVTTAHHHFKMGHVAVLFDNSTVLDKYSPSLTQMLLKNFNVQTQTIAQQITTNNDVDVVMDVVDNVNSFECTTVVAVVDDRFYRYGVYNLCSRARSKLIIVNKDQFNTFTFKNTELVQWQWQWNNAFNGAFKIIP